MQDERWMNQEANVILVLMMLLDFDCCCCCYYYYRTLVDDIVLVLVDCNKGDADGYNVLTEW